ncbi:pleiotropic drug resistance protein [Salix suchowensis]|nr:pleiotropic drug resistance protein [Salix suchowensis]
MKTGGRLIYSGQLGQRSSALIEYFERIPMWCGSGLLYLYHVLGTRGYVHLAVWRSGQGNTVFGETKTASAFIEDYFGYRQNFLGVAGLVLITIPIVVASLFTYFIGKLNFQRR